MGARDPPGGSVLPMALVAAQLAETARQAACFGLGVFLRRSDALSSSDGLAAHRLMLTLLIPVLLVGMNVNSGAILEPASQLVVLITLCHFLLLWLGSSIAFRNLPVRDRGIGTVLVTCVSCCFSGLLYHGVRDTLVGGRAVLVCDLPATLLSFVFAAVVLVRTRGRLLGGTMPGKYRHQDGGIYSGEWKGFSKHGFGTHTYPSGSIYSGEWKDNVKEGCGTYRYASGGAYIGSWRKGNPSGMGIRVYKSGKSSHGNFVDGKLESALPAEVCEGTIERSMRAAKQASSIAEERTQPLYQKVCAEILDIFPILFVLCVHKLPQVFSTLISGQVAGVVLLFLAPLASLAFGLQSAFGPGLSESTLLDVRGVLSFRYAVSTLFLGLLLAMAPAAVAPSHCKIALSCILCPVSPMLVLLTDKYTMETKAFVRAVIGWSMVVSLGLTASTQVLWTASGNYAASAFAFASSAGLFYAHHASMKGKRSPSRIAAVMSGATSVGQRRRVRPIVCGSRGPGNRVFFSTGKMGIATRALRRAPVTARVGHSIPPKPRRGTRVLSVVWANGRKMGGALLK